MEQRADSAESSLNRHETRCFADGQFEQAIGVALESRRLDKLEEAVQRAPDTASTLDYALQVCQRMVWLCSTAWFWSLRAH